MLIKGVVEFGRGNLKYKVEVRSKDEIGWLATAFNEMATQRKQAEEIIQASLTEKKPSSINWKRKSPNVKR